MSALSLFYCTTHKTVASVSFTCTHHFIHRLPHTLPLTSHTHFFSPFLDVFDEFVAPDEEPSRRALLPVELQTVCLVVVLALGGGGWC